MIFFLVITNFLLKTATIQSYIQFYKLERNHYSLNVRKIPERLHYPNFFPGTAINLHYKTQKKVPFLNSPPKK